MSWRTKEKLEKIIVSLNGTLLESLPKMDEAALQVLLVVNENSRLVGVITDGDIRRAILKGLDLKTQLHEVMHPNPRSLPVNTSINKVKKIMQQHNIRHIPLIDNDGKVQDLIVWTDCYGNIPNKRREKVVIMAGGKGTRLDPFTKILPKPMIPLGDKPIIEVIMDKFYQQGFSEFILSLGYKAEIVKMYFAESNSRPYRVSFIREEQPLGTAGALKQLKDKITDTFVVTNCDIILEPNFSDLIKNHQEQKNDLTLVGSVKEYIIPYGVIQTEGQNLLTINEKPNFHYLVNTGVYVLEPGVIDLINDNEFVHMTDLFQRIKENGGKVGVYPHHGNWFDVGQWEDYRNSLRYLGAIE